MTDPTLTDTKICGTTFGSTSRSSRPTVFYCELDPNHDGLHGIPRKDKWGEEVDDTARRAVAASALTDEELAEIEARAGLATAGPWEHIPPLSVDGTIHKVRGSESVMPILAMTDTGYSSNSSWQRRNDDAAFIAHARSDVPRLIAALRASREEIKQLSANQVTHEYDEDTGYCLCHCCDHGI